MKAPSRQIRFVVALPSEAKPINHYFKLIRDNNAAPFSLYRNHGVALVISGIGASFRNRRHAGCLSCPNRPSGSTPVLQGTRIFRSVRRCLHLEILQQSSGKGGGPSCLPHRPAAALR